MNWEEFIEGAYIEITEKIIQFDSVDIFSITNELSITHFKEGFIYTDYLISIDVFRDERQEYINELYDYFLRQEVAKNIRIITRGDVYMSLNNSVIKIKIVISGKYHYKKKILEAYNIILNSINSFVTNMIY